MAASDHAAFDIGHPSPGRGEIGVGSLLLGLFGGPVAWAIQLVAIYSLASYACDPARLQPGPMPAADRLWWLLPLVNAAALLTAALATALSVRHLRRTRREHAGHSSDLLEAGEGRTRFLSIWGIWAGALFLLAIAFNTISVFWVGLCSL